MPFLEGRNQFVTNTRPKHFNLAPSNLVIFLFEILSLGQITITIKLKISIHNDDSCHPRSPHPYLLLYPKTNRNTQTLTHPNRYLWGSINLSTSSGDSDFSIEKEIDRLQVSLYLSSSLILSFSLTYPHILYTHMRVYIGWGYTDSESINSDIESYLQSSKSYLGESWFWERAALPWNF